MLMKVTRIAPVELGACSRCEVRAHALFSALDARSLERVQPAVISLAFAPGETIYRHGAESAAVFTVREGIVRFEKVTEAGERRIVRLAGRGALIGQEAVVHRPYAEEAVACTPVRLCRIPHPSIADLQRNEPSLVRELMRRWQCALEAAEDWTSDLKSGPARRRVLKLLALVREHGAAGEPVWLPPRHEMGVMLGMATETASRIVSALRREGVVAPCGIERAHIDAGLLRGALDRLDREAA